MGNLRGTFRLSEGWPLFLTISVCLLLEGRLSLHDFVCDRVLFSLNKDFFRYYEKTSFGVKIVILEIPVFLRLLWSGVVGAIGTFVTEQDANMLS